MNTSEIDYFRGQMAFYSQNRMKGKSAVKAVAVVLLLCTVVMSTVALTGCKRTNVLFEQIHDQENGKLDQTKETLWEENPDAPEDPTRDSQFESQNENLAQQENTKTTFDENPNNTDEQTEQREQQETSHDYNATKGTQAEGSAGKTAEIASNDNGAGGGGTDNSQTVPSGMGGGTKVWDAASASTPLPENVHTVAASGDYGILVEMLCGQGALVGTDDTAKAKAAAKGAFPGEGFESVATCWDGSGTPILSEIKAQSPNCILQANDTRALTQAEMDALSEAGLNCEVLNLPDLGGATTSDSDLCSAVTTVGELMHPAAGETSTYDSAESAKRYIELHDNVISICVDANGGYSYKVVNGASYGYIYQGEAGVGTASSRLSNNRYTTVFINSWVSAGVSSVSSTRSYAGSSVGYLSDTSNTLDVSGGVGLSMSGQNAGFLLMDYYLQCAGVTDNSYEGSAPVAASASTLQALPSVISAGDYKGLSLSVSVDGRSAPSALWYSPSGDWKNDTLLVGDSSGKFPGIFVRTSEIGEQLQASASLSNGYYNMNTKYTYLVMPAGLFGSWADGGLESFLLAPYAFGYYVGNSSMTETYAQAASNFASLFYRTSADTVFDYVNGA